MSDSERAVRAMKSEPLADDGDGEEAAAACSPQCEVKQEMEPSVSAVKQEPAEHEDVAIEARTQHRLDIKQEMDIGPTVLQASYPCASSHRYG